MPYITIVTEHIEPDEIAVDLWFRPERFQCL